MSILKRNVNELLQKIKEGEDGFKEELFELTYNHLKIIAIIAKLSITLFN